jgi:2'-5' RNA ligase
MKRLFIATKIELNEQYMSLLRQLQQQLAGDRIVWVDSQLQHLTLRFLGQTPDAQIPKLKKAMNEVANHTQAFTLNMDKLGIFGSKYAPSVIWLGFSEFEAYKMLFETMEERIIDLGFEPNHGNLVPHITLGRIKETQSKKYFWQVIEKNEPDFTQSFPITEITLYQSRLQPTGPIYTPLHTVGFRR